jgi:hypothetical protein
MIENISKLPPIPAARSVNPVDRPTAQSTVSTRQTGVEFGEILQQQLNTPDSLKFSAHAQNRLLSRQISLNEHQMSHSF